MLNETQLKHLELFGFVILKNIFTTKELEILRSEFEIACKNNELKQGPYDNTYRYMNMLGKDTPFYASLIEDPRFYKPVTQWFGEKSFGFEPEVTIKLAKRKLKFFEVAISYSGRTYMEGKKIDLNK